MDWTLLDEKVIVAYILPDQIGMERLTVRLMNLMTDLSKPVINRFFTLIRSRDEWTIMISEKNFEQIRPIVYSPLTYYVIQLHESQQFMRQTGIVAQVSAILALNKIDMLYVTSYNSNYVFVPEEHLVRTMELLSKNFNSNCDFESFHLGLQFH